MLEIKNYSKSYGKRKIIDNFSFTFPEKGVVCLLGSSGCGKTTLINSLSGIDCDYEGNIYFNNENITRLNDLKRRDFRLNNVGYVFQNFNLFNLLTVEDNLRLPLYSSSNSTKRIKEKRISDLLEILDISRLKRQRINKLSGGEKQRVAIARALVNNPKILLCDEPTGALDERNTKEICKILKTISTKALVVVATHDLNVVKTIADIVIKLDEQIAIENIDNNFTCIDKPIIACNKRATRSSLPVIFQIKQAFEKIKSKKFRSLIVNSVLSLSLVGVGISLIISNNLSSKINQTFEELTNGNQIVMTLKNESSNTLGEIYSAPFNKVQKVIDKYNYYIDGYGVNYLVNYEDFFRDKNDFYINIKGNKFYLNGYSTRSINDFRTINSNLTIFPYSISNLNNDQIVLGITYVDMVNLCFNLQIQRNYKSLGEYIRLNKFYVSLELENKLWQYDDEQIFEVCGITETNSSCIFHTNNLFNQNVFESMMKLPSIDNKNQKFPWEMYKIYYVETKDDSSILLNEVLYDSDMFDYVFDRVNETYNPELCRNNECKENRIYVYLSDKYAVNLGDIKSIKKLAPQIENYFINSDYGYSSYASNILNGFSKNFYISSNEDDLITSIDADSFVEKGSNLTVNLPENVLLGNYLNSLENGVKFSNLPKDYLAGRPPNNTNEIAISLGLANSLKLDNHGLGTYLYMSSIKSEELINDKTSKEYTIAKVVVTGVINEKKNYLYHDSNWTLSFFRDEIGVSAFSLIPRSVVFELKNDVKTKDIVELLNSRFSKYKFESPLDEIDKSISSTFEYANIMLTAFSILSTVISILLLGTVILLNILESKEEIKLMNYLGIRNDDIQSTFIVQSLVHGLTAFFIASIETIIIDYFITISIGEMFKTSLAYIFNPMPIVIIFLVSILLPFIVSLFMSRFIIKSKNKYFLFFIFSFMVNILSKEKTYEG